MTLDITVDNVLARLRAGETIVGQYVMARRGGAGGYEVGNVYLATTGENIAEGNAKRRGKTAP